VAIALGNALAIGPICAMPHFIIAASLFFLCALCQLALAQQTISIDVGSRANGFHVPQEFNGKRISARAPDGDGVTDIIWDLLSLVTDKHDLEIYQADGVSNAFALVMGKDDRARRVIVYDAKWMGVLESKAYGVILAHEVGHHICRHTVGDFLVAPRNMELEADRAAGALLRRQRDRVEANPGQDWAPTLYHHDNMLAVAQSYFNALPSKSHPTTEMRLKAYSDGWHMGSPCLEKYEPINPFRSMGVIERAAYPFERPVFFESNGSKFRADVDANLKRLNGLKLVFDAVGAFDAAAGVKRGAVLFESKIGDEGTVWHYAKSCAQPLPDPDGRISHLWGLGNFYINFKSISPSRCEFEKDATPITRTFMLMDEPTPDRNAVVFRISPNVSGGIHNLRTGPGIRYSLVVSIPAGSDDVEVMLDSCRQPDDGVSKQKWCPASWRGNSGWLSLSGLVK
jgi:hypothetical protein